MSTTGSVASASGERKRLVSSGPPRVDLSRWTHDVVAWASMTAFASVRPDDAVFGPDDQEAFEAARDQIVAEFELAGGRQFGRVAEQVLDLKWSYLDGDLERWSTEDVEAILLEVYPAKVLLDEKQVGEVPAGFAALLRFLGAALPTAKRRSRRSRNTSSG